MSYKKEEFLKRAYSVHGNKYSYNEDTIGKAVEKVEIKCNKCNKIFYQQAYTHLKGHGCPFCANKIRNQKRKYTPEEIIKKIEEKHGDIYDLSLIENSYRGMLYPIKVICKKHGLFEPLAVNIISGHKCPKCAKEELSIQLKKTTEDFISQARVVWGSVYDYSKTNYAEFDPKKGKKKLEIICKKHGSFWQNPENHLNGQGCPKCSASTGERKIMEFLDQNSIKYNYNKGLPGCTTKQGRSLRFDFFLPDFNTCIEFDGPQHFYKTSTFLYKGEPLDQREQNFLKRMEYDNIKNEYCKEKGIKLIRLKFYLFNTYEKIENFLKEELKIQV